MVVTPAAVPKVVSDTLLMTGFVDTVTAPVAVLALIVRLPVPPTPPEIVKVDVPVEAKRVPPPFTVTAPLTVSAEVELASVMVVTLEPTAALVVTRPAPVPELVIVPALLIVIVVMFIVPALAFNVTLPVPVTPPVTFTILLLDAPRMVRLLFNVIAPL